MLAAGALVASLFAVGAGPVSAQPGSTVDAQDPNHNPDAGAEWSACVGAARTHDAMFPDADDFGPHADAINCIAYYGITLGKGDGSYAPDENVSAFQMELFTRRAADLMGADGEAVLAKVALSETVTRLEMAKLMFGLVDDIDGDVRIDPRDNQIKFYRDDYKWHLVDDYFADVLGAPGRPGKTIAESQLVGATYELGITRGTKGDGTLVSTPGSTFEPDAPVTRAQMASFIARTLDHSNARPEGLAMQRNNRKDTMVSYRDADFEPVESVRIDVFSTLLPGEAFDADDGSCERAYVKDEVVSYNEDSLCEIQIIDYVTDDYGNVEYGKLRSDDTAPTSVTTCSSADVAASKFESDLGGAGARLLGVDRQPRRRSRRGHRPHRDRGRGPPGGQGRPRLRARLGRSAHRRRVGQDGRDGHLHAAAALTARL